LLPLSLTAQNAQLSGQVTDQQGAALPNAEVEIINQDTLAKRPTVTDAEGHFSALYLPSGRYQVVVKAKGFSVEVSPDLVLAGGQAFVYNVQLTVASVVSNVNVEAGNVAQVEIENAEASGTIVGKEVTQIGLNGRNFTQFIKLVPGVSNQTGQDEARVGVTGSVSYSVNGGRVEYNSFQVDGSETLNTGMHKDNTTLVVYPSIDAIQSVKVLTSNYSAIYPSAGSGSTIVTTKSGGDRLHGSLYEFFRNEALNAKGYFDVGTRAPLYRRNDFGGTLGGPVVIPGLYNGRTKTHFFFSEEARIEMDPYVFRQAVPSLKERGLDPSQPGVYDFSDVCPPAGSNTTFTRSKFPDCPSSALAPGGLALAAFPFNQLNFQQPVNRNGVALLSTGLLPLPNATSGCNSRIGSCYNADVSLPTNWREELFRIDHNISSKIQTSFRYIHDSWDATMPVPQWGNIQNSFPTVQNKFHGPGTSMVATLSNSLSNSFLNTLVVSYVNSDITLTDVAGPGANLTRPALLDAPCAPDSDPRYRLYLQCPMGSFFGGSQATAKIPALVIAGNNAAYGGTGFALDTDYTPWQHTNPTYSLADNVIKVLGNHNLQLGAHWILFQRNQTNGPIGAASGDTQGILTFSNVQGNHTGNSFADMLFYSGASGNTNPDNLGGGIASFQQDTGRARYYQRYQIVEPYFQDDWRPSSRLAINLGLRLSLFGNYYEKNRSISNWVRSAYDPALALTVSNNGGAGGNLAGFLYDVNGPVSIFLSNGTIDPRIINGLVPCGHAGVPASCESGHLVNPSPRIGLAYNPDGKGKTSIRAGYGIFFEHGTGDEANTGSLEGSAPLVLSMTQNSPFGWGTIGKLGQRSGIASPVNVTGIPVETVWPYVQQWSVSVQRELPHNLVATAAYVGSKGTHLATELQLNQLRPAPDSQNPFGPQQPLLASMCQGADHPGGAFYGSYFVVNQRIVTAAQPPFTNLQAACWGQPNTGFPLPDSLRPFPGLGNIYSLQDVADSSYHAMQLTLRRTKGPLYLETAYTYSHSIDDSSDRSDATFVNSYDLSSNRASSSFDQRHVVRVSYVYDLPSKRLQDWSWLSSILEHWQVSGITSFETGIPFTVVNAGGSTGVGLVDNAGVANGVGAGSYPDLFGDPLGAIPQGGNNSASFGPLLLNPGAFRAPRGLTFGNAGRNSLRNPRYTNFDLALLKRFLLPGENSFEFRVESFNLFNHTQFRIYDPTLGNQANNSISCYAGQDGNFSAAGGGATDCLTGSAFLHPRSAHRPRTLQLALKFEF